MFRTCLSAEDIFLKVERSGIKVTVGSGLKVIKITSPKSVMYIDLFTEFENVIKKVRDMRE